MVWCWYVPWKWFWTFLVPSLVWPNWSFWRAFLVAGNSFSVASLVRPSSVALGHPLVLAGAVVEVACLKTRWKLWLEIVLSPRRVEHCNEMNHWYDTSYFLFGVCWGHLFFKYYSRIIDIWYTQPYTYCKTVVSFIHHDFREKLSCGSKYPTHPLQIRWAEIGQKLLGNE